MSRPSNLPDWATGANYSAGLYPGQANRATPPAGNVTEGFNPGNGIPAEWLNWLFNNHGQWIDYHDAAIVGSNFHHADDFMGNTLDLGKWINTSAGGGTPTVASDANADGVLVLNSNANGMSTSVGTRLINTIGTSTNFAFSVRARLTSALTPATAQAFFALTAIGLDWGITTVSGNNFFVFKYGAGASSFTTAIALTDLTYHSYLVVRVGGTIYLSIDGTQVFSAADVASDSSISFTLSTADTTSVAAADVDSAKLWIDR